jgi:hypothetical protein
MAVSVGQQDAPLGKMTAAFLNNTAAFLKGHIAALAALALLLLMAFAVPSNAAAPCADMNPDLSCCENCLATDCLCAARAPSADGPAVFYEPVAAPMAHLGIAQDSRTGLEPSPLRRPPRIMVFGRII